MGKKYLIYVDILGFEKLAKKIAKDRRMRAKIVRKHFIDVIKEKVKDIETEHSIVGKHYGESDDWILVADSLDNAFGIVSEILDHNTGYEGHEEIPLEIGIGVAEYDRWAKFDGKDLITEDETINFLKTYLLKYYHTWYKKRKKKKIKSTFVVLTEEAYRRLEPLDKKMCEKIHYEKKKEDEKEEIEVITFFLADVKKIQQRGRIFDFLRKIGYPGSRLYGRIDDVYVPPVEYGDIKKTLKKEKIAFITGTQEYGKTYTAVRLMWEYFKKGYEPHWIKGGEERERITVRQRLEEIRAELKPNHIIYFEDPFGKTKYEKREGLEKEIGTIIDCVRRADNVYVIITSREEVFKEFEKEKLTKKSIREFEKSLNLKTPSYGVEKRKEILARWAESEGCTWFGDERLRDPVLESMEIEEVLSTPLRIRNFAIDTVNVDRKDQLEEKIREKSEEVAMAFSREIKSMSDDKILFLMLLFIFDYFEVDFVRKMYEKMARNLCKKGALEFDRILDWFKDDKVSVGEYVRFSHPAYFEALENLLVENGYITRLNRRIFSRLLIHLSEKDEAAWSVARVVTRNFDKLPKKVRNNLLLSLSEKDKAAGNVAWFVAENFDELPENVRNLLFTLAEKDEAAGNVAWFVAENFDELPEDVRNRLLFTLAEKDRTAMSVAEPVVKHFDELPEDVRNRLLFILAEKDSTARSVAEPVVKHFDELPEDVRNRLLFTLAEKDSTARSVAWFVAENFDKLPKDARNNLLLELSKKEELAGTVKRIIREHSHELPENIRNFAKSI